MRNLKIFYQISTKRASEILKQYDHVLRITNLNIDLYDEVAKLSPFGPGNLKPRFLINNCNLSLIKVVGNNHHALLIEDFYGNKIRGIAFNSANQDIGNFLDRYSGENVDLVVTIKRNEWNKEISVQLQVEDIIVN